MFSQSRAMKLGLERFERRFTATSQFRYTFDDITHFRSFLTAGTGILAFSATTRCFATCTTATHLSSSFSFRFSLEIMKLHIFVVSELSSLIRFISNFGHLKLLECLDSHISIVGTIFGPREQFSTNFSKSSKLKNRSHRTAGEDTLAS